MLLISGGHSLIVFVKSPLEFQLLGSSLDDAPGEIFDKTARLLKLQHVPEYREISGGKAVEMMAKESKSGPLSFDFPQVMTGDRNCNFSFAGLKYHARKLILRQERDLDIKGGAIIPSASDICSSLQLAVLRHLSTRLSRAISFCDREELWSESKKTVVCEIVSDIFLPLLFPIFFELGCQWRSCKQPVSTGWFGPCMPNPWL